MIFTWWYMHEGRLATDGSNYAAYFGAAISVSQNGCVNIHQGDRMQLHQAENLARPALRRLAPTSCLLGAPAAK